MVPVKKITITRAEGPTKRCGIPHEFPNFGRAAAWLRSQADTFPANGGYDKHDFKVEFEDGETYEGRLDCKHHSCANSDLDVHEHILSLCRWMSGRETHPHCGLEAYKGLVMRYGEKVVKDYGDFIDTYLT